MFPSAQWSSLCGMGAAAKQQVRLLPGRIHSAQRSKAMPMSPRVYASPVSRLRNKKTSKICSSSGSFEQHFTATWFRMFKK
jgi:hypothetical protein